MLTVEKIEYKLASKFVLQYHYLKTIPKNVMLSIGLFDGIELCGCITYSKPHSRGTLLICGEKNQDKIIELSRLVLLDRMPRNTESWFISRSNAILKQEYPEKIVLVSFADRDVGHIGTIYQATNFVYTGICDTNKYRYVLFLANRKPLLKMLKWKAHQYPKSIANIQQSIEIKHYRFSRMVDVERMNASDVINYFHFGVCQSTILAWMKQGLIESFKDKSRWYTTKNAVSIAIKSKTIPPKLGKKRQYTEQDKTQMKQLKNSGKTLSSIAERFGCDQSYVSLVVRGKR